MAVESIPTEPIGSIPRSDKLLRAIAEKGPTSPELDDLYEDAIKDTIKRFEETGSPVITDGEQRKYHNFLTYSIHGSTNMVSEGFKIPFAAGHIRRMPRLIKGPFRYLRYADSYLDTAKYFTRSPLKQAVISPSALSLLYPEEEIEGYPRATFIDDLISEHVKEVRNCINKGAEKVQIDFTEGRLALKLDPTRHLLQSFIDLNNLALSHFSLEDRKMIGIHTCPGGDCDSTHSADVDYAELLPSLFSLKAGNFYIYLAGEKDKERVLKIVSENLNPDQKVFIGVIDPISKRIETAKEVSEMALNASKFIPVEQLGTTDDCGFSPFCDDISTSRDTALAKIKARVEGTSLAFKQLGGF